ncbi:MAG: hypothetical protein KF795_07790 [Labilithrix sp.]|nr:hypothetical protein [Labilithrix sp.]
MRGVRHLGGWTAALAFALASCGDDPDALNGNGTSRRRSGASSSGASSGASGTPESGDVVTGTGESANELCWSTINEYRKRAGLPLYERWTEAEACSDGEAKSDAETNRPHGAFPRCGELAQNECPGTPGPPEEGIPGCLAMMWAEGPGGGHHDNMASTQYTKAACGVFVTSRGAIWSVQNFR